MNRGEPAFHEAAEELRNMNSLPPLELKSEICIPLPEDEEEIKDSSYLKEQVKAIRETTNIDGRHHPLPAAHDRIRQGRPVRQRGRLPQRVG